MNTVAQNNREEANHQGPQTKRYSPEVRAQFCVHGVPYNIIIWQLELINPTTFKYPVMATLKYLITFPLILQIPLKLIAKITK